MTRRDRENKRRRGRSHVATQARRKKEALKQATENKKKSRKSLSVEMAKLGYMLVDGKWRRDFTRERVV